MLFSRWNFLYSAQKLHCDSPVLVFSIQSKTWSSFLSALLNWHKNSNFFKLAVLRSDSMKWSDLKTSLAPLWSISIHIYAIHCSSCNGPLNNFWNNGNSYRVHNDKVFFLNWLWRIEKCTSAFVWRWFWNSETRFF